MEQNILYCLAFGAATALLVLGATRHWVLIVSVLGPAVVAAFTLTTLVADQEGVFEDDRLVVSIGESPDSGKMNLDRKLASAFAKGF